MNRHCREAGYDLEGTHGRRRPQRSDGTPHPRECGFSCVLAQRNQQRGVAEVIDPETQNGIILFDPSQAEGAASLSTV